jgi:ABC-type Na+ efflux pump permease subunit
MVAILGTELRRRLADRSIIVSSFVAPAVIAAIIGFAFGGSATVPVVRIGVALDQQSSQAEAVVSAGIDAAGLGSQVEVVNVSSPSALRHQVSSGALAAGVIIPVGFASRTSFGIPARPFKSSTAGVGPSALPGLLADVTIGPGNGPPSARLTVVSQSTSSVDGQLGQAVAAAISSRLYAGALELTVVPGPPPTTKAALAVLTARAQATAESRSVLLRLTPLSVGSNHGVIGYYGSSIAVVFLFIGAGLGTRAIAMERTASPQLLSVRLWSSSAR